MARILIVDDSAPQRLALQKIVERMGHEALLADEGEAGFQKAFQEIPDLILMDVVMPVMNGYQATRKLTQDPVTAHIPVVLVTSKDQSSDEAWGRRQGALDYITKPIDEEALGDVIRRLITQVEVLHQTLSARTAAGLPPA